MDVNTCSYCHRTFNTANGLSIHTAACKELKRVLKDDFGVSVDEDYRGKRGRRGGVKRSAACASVELDMLAGVLSGLRDDMATLNESVSAILRLNKRLCRLLLP